MDKHNVLWSIFLHGNCSSSLSLLPAGGGGLSGLACVEAILQGITDHLSSTASSVLKLIYVVIQQENIFQAFVVGFRLWKLKQRVSSHTCTPVYTWYLDIHYYFHKAIPRSLCFLSIFTAAVSLSSCYFLQQPFPPKPCCVGFMWLKLL